MPNNPTQVEPVEGLVERLARADHARAVYARALEKMRIALLAVRDGLEDEGDRVYLGSTNHADLLVDAWNEADSLKWDEVLVDSQPSTALAQVNLNLQAALSQASEREAKLVAENERLRGLLARLCPPTIAAQDYVETLGETE